MKRTLFPVAFILIFPITSMAQSGLSLAETVKRGLDNDNIVKAQAQQVSGAKAGLEQARMSRLGGFQLTGAYTDGTDPVYVFASAMKQGDFSMASLANINNPDPVRNYMGGIEAGVPLFTGFAISNAVKMGGLGVEAARDSYERAKAGITFKLTYQWLTVLLQAKLAELADQSVEASSSELTTAQMLKDRGMVLGSDYYGAEAIFSTLKGYRLAWHRALDLEREKLGIEIGLPGTADAAGKLTDPGYTPLNRGALEAAAAGRNDVKAMQAMAEIARTRLATQKDSILPTVQAFGAWETNSNSLSEFKGNRMLGVRLTMPIGDPAYFAKADRAKAEAAQAGTRADEARKQAGIELEEAIDDYNAAKEALPVAEETVRKAEKSLELFRPLYRQGRQSVLEVLRAQASVLQAQAAYYETFYKLNLYHTQALLASETLDASAVQFMSDKLGTGS